MDEYIFFFLLSLKDTSRRVNDDDSIATTNDAIDFTYTFQYEKKVRVIKIFQKKKWEKEYYHCLHFH